LANPGDLFVRFFATKPDGFGLGLTLRRQIAGSHGGTLTSENRSDGSAC
jgi:two-component system nitrogen regulation sensor histidine kinase NtrY